MTDRSLTRRRALGGLLLLGTAGALASGGWLIPADAAPPAGPVLVELYQSQGCSSCPPANANVNALAGRPDVVALSFAVTYWDGLGWRDTFAKPQFTARQWEYARANDRPNVATPQVWLNGRSTIVGSNPRQLDAAIVAARAAGPALAIGGGAVAVGPGAAPGNGADVWVALYDPRSVAVPIRAGENGGRTLPHRNIVRQLVNLGRWTGQPVRYPLPAVPDGLAVAAFVQGGGGGPVVAATKAS